MRGVPRPAEPEAGRLLRVLLVWLRAMPAGPGGAWLLHEERAAMSQLRGSCLCGAVHYTVDDDFRYALNCHCSQCRRATGAAFKSFAGIERGRLALTAGHGDLLIVGDEAQNHDVRCGKCGSLLYSVVRDGAYVHVTLG